MYISRRACAGTVKVEEHGVRLVWPERLPHALRAPDFQALVQVVHAQPQRLAAQTELDEALHTRLPAVTNSGFLDDNNAVQRCAVCATLVYNTGCLNARLRKESDEPGRACPYSAPADRCPPSLTCWNSRSASGSDCGSAASLRAPQRASLPRLRARLSGLLPRRRRPADSAWRHTSGPGVWPHVCKVCCMTAQRTTARYMSAKRLSACDTVASRHSYCVL